MKTNTENNYDGKDNSYYSKEKLLLRLKEIKNGAQKQSFDSIISQESTESMQERLEYLKKIRSEGISFSNSHQMQHISLDHTGENPINESRLKRFEEMNIPLPLPKPYYEVSRFSQAKDPKMAERIKEILNGDAKKEINKFIDETEIINDSTNGFFENKKTKIALPICPPKYDAEGKLPELEPIKLEDFTPKIESPKFINQYSTLIIGTEDADNLIESENKVKDRSEIKNPYYVHNSDLDKKIKAKLNEFTKKHSNPDQVASVKDVKKYEKDFGTYFEKRNQLLLQEEEERKVKKVQQLDMQKEKMIKSKFKFDFNKYMLSIKLFLIAKFHLFTQKFSNLKNSFNSWLKSIPNRWNNFKLSLVMSKQQRELLARLPEALAPKVEINNEPEVPRAFKVFNKKSSTFNYNDMKSFNKRLMEIPE